MKKLKLYGAVLVLVLLILFDIGIYSRIFGISIAPVTTLTNSLFDALSGNRDSNDSVNEVHLEAGRQYPDESHISADETVQMTAADTEVSSARKDEAAPEKPDTDKDSGSESQSETSEDNRGTTAGEPQGQADSDAAGNSEAGKPDQKHIETPEITYAELSGIPIYSILNGPENYFLNVIAGYDDNNYSYTMVTACIPTDGSIWDKPAPVSITVPDDEPGRTYEVQVYSTLEENTIFVQRGIPSGGTAEIYNLIPGDLCGCQIFAEEYTATSDSGEGSQIISSHLVVSESFCVRSYEMRGIRTESLNNVRDLGGWSTADGRHVRYGLLYRGSAFDGGGQRLISDNDASLFLNRLGIRNELDLRWDSEIMLDGVSSLSESLNYIRVPMQLYLDFVSDETNAGQVVQIFDMLNSEGPLYYHCAIGCDRTGTLSFLILGLLGVSESDINKEYELSSFSIYGPRTRDNTETYYKEMIAYIKQNFEGATLQDKIENYLLQRGVSKETIDSFRAKMLE